MMGHEIFDENVLAEKARNSLMVLAESVTIRDLGQVDMFEHASAVSPNVG